MRNAPINPAVYAIRNLRNGRTYVGGAKNYSGRFNCHRCELRKGRHRNRFLQQDWNEFGPDAFAFFVLEVVGVDELRDCEQRWLDLIDDKYNICSQSDSSAGVTRSEEFVRKLSASKTGRKTAPLTAEHRAKIAEKARLRRHSPETRKKMRDAQLRRNAGGRA